MLLLQASCSPSSHAFWCCCLFSLSSSSSSDRMRVGQLGSLDLSRLIQPSSCYIAWSSRDWSCGAAEGCREVSREDLKPGYGVVKEGGGPSSRPVPSAFESLEMPPSLELLESSSSSSSSSSLSSPSLTGCSAHLLAAAWSVME
jgi:hypothetical protein